MDNIVETEDPRVRERKLAACGHLCPSSRIKRTVRCCRLRPLVVGDRRSSGWLPIETDEIQLRESLHGMARRNEKKKRERKVARFRVIPRREQCRCSMGVGFQGILKGHDPSKGTRVARRTSCRGIGARPLRENDNFFFRKGRILGLAGTRSTLDWQQE